MSCLAHIVKRFLIPGSMTFLIVGFAIGVGLLDSGRVPIPWARIWLTALLGLYLLLSLPVTAHALIQSLQRRHDTLPTMKDSARARVLVVFGNGAVHYTAGHFIIDQLTRRSAFCVLEAARLYRLMEPAWLVASGGDTGVGERARAESELIRDELVRFDVPAERILVESTSRTTVEQVTNVARLLAERGLGGPIVVVTTGAHLPRVMNLLHDHGIEATGSAPSALRYDQGRASWRRWYPSSAALRGSESAIYEYLAGGYAAVRSVNRVAPPFS